MKPFDTVASLGIALCIAVGPTASAAFAPDDMQIVGQVYQQLTSQGYDTTGFEDLTLSQIVLIHTKLEEGGSRGLIQGMLNGTCGGTVILDRATLEELLMN